MVLIDDLRMPDLIEVEDGAPVGWVGMPRARLDACT